MRGQIEQQCLVIYLSLNHDILKNIWELVTEFIYKKSRVPRRPLCIISYTIHCQIDILFNKP